MELYDYQLEAVKRMRNGCILCGGVGSGKSITAMAWYYLENGGEWACLEGEEYVPMDDPPADLYIITTARKRDTHEWGKELGYFLLSENPKTNLYANRVVVDSWNNIGKYVDVEGAIFLFDEQHVVGSGSWVKSFLKITKKNRWVLLSATPGDCWKDYIPVFVANGFYKNRTQFLREHAVFSRVTKFPKIERYLNTGKLLRLRSQILVNMEFKRPTVAHHEDVYVPYSVEEYKEIYRTRWNKLANRPIENGSELCFLLRRLVNMDEARQEKAIEIAEKHPRMIVFYSFNYELELLKNLAWPQGTVIAELNGRRHDAVPESERWVYLVQYSSGSEAWNCITTDTILLYSQQYSYRVLIQSCGRIDRANTPYSDLYFYHLKSRSGIDIGINRALKDKKDFNENDFVKW